VAIELDDRERDITRLALHLLAQLRPDKTALDEATIDANFIFRFDPAWCKRVSRIRGMMRALLGQGGDGPLSVEDGATWLVHLEANEGLQISVQVGPDNSGWEIRTKRGGGYSCLDPELKEKLNPRFPDAASIFSLDPALRKQLHQLMLMEANQTSKIQEQLRGLARYYGLVPRHKADEWSPNEIKRQFQSVVHWVVWGEKHTVPPTFPSLWKGAVLREQKIGEGITRTVTPWPRPEGGHWCENKDGSRTWVKAPPSPSKRMTKEVRVRTWTVYRITKRGGGRCTEEAAVSAWNDEFNENLEAQNFRAERGRLFSKGTRKSA
jgi:hypothetical protein